MKTNKLFLTGLAALSFFFSVKTHAQAPTAAFALNQPSLCSGGTVTITDASSDSPTAWSYTVDGPATIFSTLQNPSIVLSIPGEYSVTLIASNGTGDSAPLTQTLNVASLPSVSAGSSAEVCAGSYVTLSASGASTYTWSNGAINGVAFPPSVSNVYTVTGTDLNGCQNVSTVPVTVDALPVLSISGSTDVCIGGIVTMTASGADSYTWNIGGTGDDITDSPIVNTTYSVTGMNSVTGCTTTITNLVTVHALPLVSVNSGSLCAGSTFTMNPSGASSYVYSNGSNMVSPIANGSYTVTGTDANGCVSAAVSDVTVNPLPTIGVNTGSICSGSVFTITPTGALTYSYSPGLSALVSPATTTSYSVTGTDANGCVSSVAAVTEVTVFASPIVSVNSGSICSGSTFTMNPTGALSFSYSNGSNVVSPVSNISYTVTGEDAIGCRSNAVSNVTVIALPVVSVNSGAICAGGSFTMVPTGASSYVFVNGSAIVSPLTNTSYSVSGASIEGCLSVGFAVSNVTVNALPVISVTSGSVCLGSAYTLTATGAATYNYQGGSATVSPVANTSYTVSGTSSNGCVSANSATANVIVMNLPVISIASPTAICFGDVATLIVSGASTYTWATTNSNLSSYSVNPSANTTFSVVGMDANGCMNFATQAIVVNSLPTITVNSGVICPGGSFTLTPSGAMVYNYTGGTATVTPATSTSYTVTGTDANGCVSAAVVSTVNVQSAITIAVTGNTSICEGQSANLTASGATTYSWNTTVLTNTISVNPIATTYYTVTGMSSGCSNTAAVLVTVNPLPVVTAISSSSLICIGDNVTLTSGGAVSYVWDNGSTISTLVVTPSVNTTYTVTGTDANSCSNKATIVQNVTDCTGITKFESTLQNVGVYPNPNNGEFTVNVTDLTSVKILNAIGEVVYSNKLENGNTVVTLNDQPNGIYFVQLKQGSQSKTVKVVKN